MFVQANSVKVTIEGSCELQSELIASGINCLVKCADPHHLAKIEDWDAPFRLYEQVLCGLASLYAADAAPPEGFTIKDVLLCLIEDCANRDESRLTGNAQSLNEDDSVN